MQSPPAQSPPSELSRIANPNGKTGVHVFYV
jgi:hypothetical protein